MKKDAPYSGMIIIHKETGYTSSDVVAKLRGILHMRKIGHTGTLDPGATGVLPVCLGSATKLCELIADRDKEYVAVCRLGVTTDTEDMSGEVLTQLPREEVLGRSGSPLPGGSLRREAFIRKTVSSFEGSYDQVPPMYSAIWVDGKRLYDLARKGITVERTPRRVTIHELELLGDPAGRSDHSHAPRPLLQGHLHPLSLPRHRRGARLRRRHGVARPHESRPVPH